MIDSTHLYIYSSWKFGFLFSAKAPIPSFWSLVAKVDQNILFSYSRPWPSGNSYDLFTQSLAMAARCHTALPMGREKLAILFPKATASSTNFSGSTILLTKPYFNAVSASMNVPVSIISMAFDFPTSLISLWVPPAPGIVPKVISGNPNCAF